MSSFLDKHPIPWSLARESYDEWLKNGEQNKDGDREVIKDANDNYVVTTSDASGYQSWFEGDMDSFINFINTLKS